MTSETDHWGDEAPKKALARIDGDPNLVEQLQSLLGEAGHVFKCHNEGIWSEPGGYKDCYAGRLAEFITERSDLTHQLLKTENRLIKMLTYRALEMQKDATAKKATVRDLYCLNDGVTANPSGRSRRPSRSGTTK